MEPSKVTGPITVSSTDNTLESVKQLLRDHHFALDMRQNGNAAAFHLVSALEKMFEMPYEQGVEDRKRSGSKIVEKAEAK